MAVIVKCADDGTNDDFRKYILSEERRCNIIYSTCFNNNFKTIFLNPPQIVGYNVCAVDVLYVYICVCACVCVCAHGLFLVCIVKSL